MTRISITLLIAGSFTATACTVPTTSDVRTGATQTAATIDNRLNGEQSLPADVRAPRQRPPATIN
ncbi:MAG: hypothetical protein AAFY73_08725 [Pseudomonadota bacterium]